MWEELGRALALVLIIEGVGPFVVPSRWRSLMARVALMDDRSLRLVGLVSMGLGLLALKLLEI